jgi:acetyl esterase
MTAPSPIVLEPAAQEVADAFSKRPFIYEKTPADARVRIIRPQGATGMLPVIVYMHGGGWILGNAETHDRLVRELAVGARAALAFADYPNSPEARYPPRSSRVTPPPSGSPATARPRAWTPAAWPWPASR